MALNYRFKKEKIEGIPTMRPRINVRIHGSITSIDVPALIDSGCDISVIPDSIAEAIGLDMKGEESELQAYRETTKVIRSKVAVTFMSRANRENVTLIIPILIALSSKDHEDEQEIVLGIARIFDGFDITFKKSQNKIILKRVSNIMDY